MWILAQTHWTFLSLLKHTKILWCLGVGHYTFYYIPFLKKDMRKDETAPAYYVLSPLPHTMAKTDQSLSSSATPAAPTTCSPVSSSGRRPSPTNAQLSSTRMTAPQG
jgi:hypothetical protein